MLAELERRAQRPVSALFDLVAGTSTGGIIACALALPDAGGAPRWRAEDLVELYRHEGPRIFARSLGRRVVSGWGLIDEKYDDDALQDALGRFLGEARLSEALVDVLVTAYDLEARAPFFFKSWRTVAEPARDHRLRDAARATAGAPTYFEPILLEAAGPPSGVAGGSTRFSLVDGGVFATNPAMCAYAEARRRFPGADVRVVSLGTGRLCRPIRHADARDWGLLEWVRPLIDVVFDGVADTVEYQLEQLLEPDRYDRFQVTLTDGASDALDDASAENVAALEARGRELIATGGDALDRLARELSR